jgi:hypothetical protein
LEDENEVKRGLDALQVQCDRDFAKYYGVTAKISFVGKGQTPLVVSYLRRYYTGRNTRLS